MTPLVLIDNIWSDRLALGARVVLCNIMGIIIGLHKFSTCRC